MKNNEYLSDQKQIFRDLLAATVLELDAYPDITKGDLTFGTNGNVLSFRNCGKGFFSGVIARAVLGWSAGRPHIGPVSDGGANDG